MQSELAAQTVLNKPGLSTSRDDVYATFLVENLLVHLDIGKDAILSAFERRSPITDDSVQGTRE